MGAGGAAFGAGGAAFGAGGAAFGAAFGAAGAQAAGAQAAGAQAFGAQVAGQQVTGLQQRTLHRFGRQVDGQQVAGQQVFGLQQRTLRHLTFGQQVFGAQVAGAQVAGAQAAGAQVAGEAATTLRTSPWGQARRGVQAPGRRPAGRWAPERRPPRRPAGRQARAARAPGRRAAGRFTQQTLHSSAGGAAGARSPERSRTWALLQRTLRHLTLHFTFGPQVSERQVAGAQAGERASCRSARAGHRLPERGWRAQGPACSTHLAAPRTFGHRFRRTGRRGHGSEAAQVREQVHWLQPKFLAALDLALDLRASRSSAHRSPDASRAGRRLPGAAGGARVWPGRRCRSAASPFLPFTFGQRSTAPGRRSAGRRGESSGRRSRTASLGLQRAPAVSRHCDKSIATTGRLPRHRSSRLSLYSPPTGQVPVAVKGFVAAGGRF